MLAYEASIHVFQSECGQTQSHTSLEKEKASFNCQKVFRCSTPMIHSTREIGLHVASF